MVLEWRLIGVSSLFRENNSFFYEKKNENFIMKGELIMTLSTLAAGVVIVSIAAALELMSKDDEQKKVQFETQN